MQLLFYLQCFESFLIKPSVISFAWNKIKLLWLKTQKCQVSPVDCWVEMVVSLFDRSISSPAPVPASGWPPADQWEASVQPVAACGWTGLGNWGVCTGDKPEPRSRSWSRWDKSNVWRLTLWKPEELFNYQFKTGLESWSIWPCCIN